MYIFSFCGLLFLLGCFCGIKFATIDILMLLFCILFIFGIKLIIFKTRTKTNLYILIFSVVFIVGGFVGAFHDYRTFNDIRSLFGTDVTVTGTVSQTSENSFVIDTEYGYIRVYSYGAFNVKNNDIVTVNGNLSGYETAQYNGDFDKRLYNARYGIIGYIECNTLQTTGSAENFSLWNAGTSIRNWIEDRIQEFNTTSKAKSFITALLTGNTEHFDENLAESFRVTGISHLTAVSGLHVGIFLSFFVLLSTRLRKSKYLYVPFILITVFLYILVIGERASLFRAGIMTVVSCFMISMKWRSDSLVNLVIAGIFICIINPYYAVDAGFQMSFLATLAIVMFSGFLKFPTLSVPFAVAMFMLPVNVYYYNMISLETVLVNIIVLPFVPFVILFGYIGCVIPLASVVSCNVADVIIWTTEFFSKMDFLHITLPSSEMHHFIIWFLLVCALYMSYSNQKLSNIAIVLLCAVLVSVAVPDKEYENSCSIRFINSGSFNVQHITTDTGREILVDCGENTVDYITKTGIGDIYMIIVTENMRGRYDDLTELVKGHTVHNVFLPESARDKNLQLENCNVLYYNQDESFLTIDELEFKFAIRSDKRCFLIKVYDDIIAVPFSKTVSGIGTCSVLCMPDKCSDGDKAEQNSSAEYYIHPTYRYYYYDCGTKFVTSQVGAVHMIFRDNREPVICTQGGRRCFFD